MPGSYSSSVIALLLILAGVKTNPGSCLTMGCLSLQSIVHKEALVLDIIDSHHPDALAICESYIVDDDPDVIKLDAFHVGFKVLHVPRPSATVRSRGDGLCFIHCDLMVVKGHSLQPILRYTSFECQLVEFHVDNSNEAALYCRPHLSTAVVKSADVLQAVRPAGQSCRRHRL